MRVKIDHLVAGQGVLPELEYAPIMAFPEIIDSTTKHLTMLPNIPRKPTGTDKFRMELAALVRAIANAPETESAEPRNGRQPAKGPMDDGLGDDMEGIDEDEEDETVDPRLRDMVKEVNQLEKAGKLPGSLPDRGNEVGNHDEGELGVLMREGKGGIEEEEEEDDDDDEDDEDDNEDSDSIELSEGDDEDGTDGGDEEGNEDG